MNRIFLINLLFLFFNIVTAQNYVLFVSDANPSQGDTLIIKLTLPTNTNIKSAFLDKEKINFVNINNNILTAFIGINAKQKPGIAKLSIQLSNNQVLTKNIIIKSKNFPITKLQTTPELEKKGFTSAKIVENLIKENKLVSTITSKFTNKVYFNQTFGYPLDKMIVVGDYGNIRKNNYDEVQHLGIDLDGQLGDAVYAINNGKVVLARELINYGKTVIIDHGAGIFSLYLHLNKINVWEGKEVKKGQKIGEVGNTGYSLGPHLHLSIKINNNSVDPLKFFSIMNNFLNSYPSENKSSNNDSALNINNNIILKKISWGFENTNKRYIDTIIIHSSYNPFDNDYYNVDKILDIYKDYDVSAHYLIDRQGKIYKLVEEKNIAYHAGKSKMPDGRINVNYFSIGIELIYHKNETPNEYQYQSLNKLIKDIKNRYQIKYILGHKDIAPQRKDDPWNFDWNKAKNNDN